MSRPYCKMPTSPTHKQLLNTFEYSDHSFYIMRKNRSYEYFSYPHTQSIQLYCSFFQIYILISSICRYSVSSCSLPGPVFLAHCSHRCSSTCLGIILFDHNGNFKFIPCKFMVVLQGYISDFTILLFLVCPDCFNC
jgi:hypothetical protein